MKRPGAGVAAAVLVVTAAATARAQGSPDDARTILLDVPYIQQSEILCGGAAAAMVLRYWGATDVYAENFAALVDRNAGGIRGESLISDLQRRGWDAHSFRGDASLVHARLTDRQPVIALIEDRPDVFHYVVIVAWENGRVVVHDPARTPFRVIDEKVFDVAWAKSQRWALLALPGAPRKSVSLTAAPSETTPDMPAESVCSSMVSTGVRTASDGGYSDALQILQAASEMCPRDSAPWREMAGVYALQNDWTNAASHARAAVARNAEDEHAWRILATSSFVSGKSADALRAWNRVGEPRVDLITVRGLERTRHSAATELMGLEPRTLLTWQALEAANRRLDELPAAQSARVAYRPLENGRAAVDAVVIERPRAPSSLPGLAVVAANAIADRELRGWFSNPTGGGDLFSAAWRWWEHRPRVGVSYATPTRAGVLEAEGFWEEQTYRAITVGSPDGVESRKSGSLTLSNWATANLRWRVGAALDDWSDRGHTVSVTGGLDERLAADRLSLGSAASLFGGSFSAWTWAAAVEWRSSPRHENHVVLARAGIETASPHAPLALWPGAGTGHGRTVLLRAHPLLDDGVVTGDVFGRRVDYAGGEWRRWFKPGLRILPIAPAVFLDVARADHRQRSREAWHADAGAGVRIAVHGAGVLRVDIARGLRDSTTAFSIGWTKFGTR